MEKIAACRPAGVLLREKDLSPAAYQRLAQRVLAICAAYGVPCILHSFPDVAASLGAEALHLPLPVLRRETLRPPVLGASCHSVEDALEAEALGCTYITAGHIFQTDCKKGLPGRGLAFLENVCRAVSIPVYAIGGVDPSNVDAVRATGVVGACVMSGPMSRENVEIYLKNLEGGG